MHWKCSEYACDAGYLAVTGYLVVKLFSVMEMRW